MNNHEYAHHLANFIKAAEIATSARPRVPRFTADEEQQIIRGLGSGAVLLAYLMNGVEDDTDDPSSDGT